MANKKCGKCGETKELSADNFPHNKRSQDGFDRYCKACWKVISSAKTKSAGASPAQRAVVDRAKAQGKGWAPPVAPAVEVIPNGVVVEAVSSFGHLPAGAKGSMYDGSLLEAIASYRERYGVDPQLLIVPAKFLLQCPEEKVAPVAKAAADKPAKSAGHKVGRGPKRSVKHVR